MQLQHAITFYDVGGAIAVIGPTVCKVKMASASILDVPQLLC